MRFLREPLRRAEVLAHTAPVASTPAHPVHPVPGAPPPARSFEPVAPPKARLLIHAARVCPESPARLAWRRLRASCSGAPAREHGTALSLEVHDLRGQRVGAFSNVGALTELLLPAGTYIVTARREGGRRGYTLTLQAGSSFELHLEASSSP